MPALKSKFHVNFLRDWQRLYATFARMASNETETYNSPMERHKRISQGMNLVNVTICITF